MNPTGSKKTVRFAPYPRTGRGRTRPVQDLPFTSPLPLEYPSALLFPSFSAIYILSPGDVGSPRSVHVDLPDALRLLQALNPDAEVKVVIPDCRWEIQPRTVIHASLADGDGNPLGSMEYRHVLSRWVLPVRDVFEHAKIFRRPITRVPGSFPIPND